MSDFATPAAAVKAGIQRATADAKIGFWRYGTVFSAFSDAHAKGISEVTAVQKALAGYAWTWPWFEKFRVAFQSAGFWPIGWTERDIEPNTAWTDIPEDVRAELLALTISSAVYVARDQANMASVARDTGMKVIIKPGDERCPAEAHFVKLNNPKIRRGNYSSLPPYFPGDSTHLRMG